MTSLIKFQIDDPKQIEQPSSYFGSLFLEVLRGGKSQFDLIFNQDPHLLLQVVLIGKIFYNTFSELLFPRLTTYQIAIATEMVCAMAPDHFGWSQEMVDVTRRFINTQNPIGKVAMCWYVALKLKTYGIHIRLYESKPNIGWTDQFAYWKSEREKFQKHFDFLFGPSISKAEVLFLPHDSGGHATNTIATHRCCTNWSFSDDITKRGHYARPPTMPHNEFQVEWLIVDSERKDLLLSQEVVFHVKQQVNAELVISPQTLCAFPHRYQQGEINSVLIIFPGGRCLTGPKNIQFLVDWFARTRFSVGPNFKLTVLSYVQNGGLNSPTPAQIVKAGLFGVAKVSPMITTRRGPGNRLIYEPDPNGIADESFNHVAKCTTSTVDICQPSCNETIPVRFQTWNFTYRHRTLPTPEDFVTDEEIPLLDAKGAPIEVYNRSVLGNLSAVLEKNGDYFWFQVAKENVSRNSPMYPDNNGDFHEDELEPPFVVLLFLVDGRAQARQSIEMDEKGVIAHFYNQFHAMTGVDWDQRHLANKPGLWQFTGRIEVPVALRGGILRNPIKREKSRDRSPTRKTRHH